MDAPTAAEDQPPSTPELKRTYLSLLSNNAIIDLVLSLDAGATSSLFPADLAGEVRRMQSNSTTDDVDGEGSPDPQPAPPPPRAPSAPLAGGPRTRAGAARAYAAALASKDSSASTRPSPAPGGVSFPQTPEPQQPQHSPPPFAPIPQPYPSLVVHLPGGSPPIPSPATPTNPTSASANPLWPPNSPTSESATGSAPGIGPVRNTPAKKTRTGVIGGYNPITSIGPSSEGLPSYEEMIVLALMESQDNEGIAPKDVFAWMSARWPLNANFRPSASQALQKAYKRGRLEKVGTKYKLNPNWHGGATTNRTTRRPQSMAEVPGNYAWAPPPVPPVVSVPPDPRARHTAGLNPPSSPTSQQTQAEFDAQAQVASLLKALQEAGPGPGPSDPNPSGAEQNQPPNEEGSIQAHLPRMSIPGAPDGAALAQPPPPEVVMAGPANESPSAPGPSQSPVQMHQLSVTMPSLPAPPQPEVPTPPIQTGMSPPAQAPKGVPPVQNPMSPPIQNGVIQIQNGISSQPTTTASSAQPSQQQVQVHHQPQTPVLPQPPHPMPPGVPIPYTPFHAPPSALQASLVTLASQLANMSKTNQGA